MTAPSSARALAHVLQPISSHGDCATTIDHVAYDSRDCRPGSVFVARSGAKHDGHAFAADAIRHGARVIVHARDLIAYRPDVCYIRVADSVAALAHASAWLHGCPGRELQTAGVTGTDGKSSTAWFAKQLIDGLGERCALVSGVFVDDGHNTTLTTSRLSTPEAPELQQLLRRARERWCAACVVEATSIGIASGRVLQLPLAVAAVTNITHEHLEYHGTWERYREAKASLIGMLARGDGVAVLNRDDPSWSFLSERAPRALSFSVRGQADCSARLDVVDGSVLRATIELDGMARQCRLQLGHAVHAANVAAACLIAGVLARAEPQDILQLCDTLRPLPGRMQPIPNARELSVFVDHAHTPAAFEHLFADWQDRRASPAGRLIVVFGSAGEKDRGKRGRQGLIASRHADLVILTDEDPRAEDSSTILTEIEKGFAPGAAAPYLIPDRRQAIERAVELARSGDTILLLGKGHERTIEYADHSVPWDEAGVAAAALAGVLPAA